MKRWRGNRVHPQESTCRDRENLLHFTLRFVYWGSPFWLEDSRSTQNLDQHPFWSGAAPSLDTTSVLHDRCKSSWLEHLWRSDFWLMEFNQTIECQLQSWNSNANINFKRWNTCYKARLSVRHNSERPREIIHLYCHLVGATQEFWEPQPVSSAAGDLNIWVERCFCFQTWYKNLFCC